MPPTTPQFNIKDPAPPGLGGLHHPYYRESAYLHEESIASDGIIGWDTQEMVIEAWNSLVDRRQLTLWLH